MIVVRKRTNVPSTNPHDSRSKSVPSPERIRELCTKIRKTWTVRERRRRAGQVPFVPLVEMPLEPRRRGFWED